MEDGKGAGAILDVPAGARLEFRCRLEGGDGRLGLKLDGRRVLDQELGEVSFVLPPIGTGQHALGITLFRQSLAARGRSELSVDGELRFELDHDPEDEGFLAEHTVFLNALG